MDQQSSSEPVPALHEIDLGQHTLFAMNDGSIDLVANDEQTVSLTDNALHLYSDEAYHLFVALYEQFKGKQAHQEKERGLINSSYTMSPNACTEEEAAEFPLLK